MLLQEIKNIKSTPKDLRNFGLVVGAALGILGGILYWNQSPNYIYVLYAGLVLGALSLIFPIILKPLQIIWMTLAVVIGWIMTRLILSILFYVVITIITLTSRILGKQFLELKWDKSQPTYWNYRDDKPFDKTVYEKQF